MYIAKIPEHAGAGGSGVGGSGAGGRVEQLEEWSRWRSGVGGSGVGEV